MSEWQPIDTAPRDGSRVLLFSGMYWPTGEVGPIPSVSVGSWRVRLGEDARGPAWRPDVRDAYDRERLAPTHWQPLPKPPTP